TKRDTPEQKTKRTMPSLLKREVDFDYDYMEKFLKEFENRQLETGKTDDFYIDYVRGPMLRDFRPYSLFSGMYDNGEQYNDVIKMVTKNRSEYKYALDLKSAYPHILK